MMNEKLYWTNSKARLTWRHSSPEGSLHWLFLPGGPGLGSESLQPLTQILDLPGHTWHLDLPGDGSNRTSNNAHYFSSWSKALVEAVDSLQQVVLVAHSTGGMYTLATPALAGKLTGLILMDSAPDATWQSHFMKTVHKHPIPELTALQEIYEKNPTDELLKKLTLASTPYIFSKTGLSKDHSFLNYLPYNSETCEWSREHFDQTYKAKWIPTNIPTLIFAGEEDMITPLSLFSNSTAFQSLSITLSSIPNAGHFPWIDNPQATKKLFVDFARLIAK